MQLGVWSFCSEIYVQDIFSFLTLLESASVGAGSWSCKIVEDFLHRGTDLREHLRPEFYAWLISSYAATLGEVTVPPWSLGSSIVQSLDLETFRMAFQSPEWSPYGQVFALHFPWTFASEVPSKAALGRKTDRGIWVPVNVALLRKGKPSSVRSLGWALAQYDCVCMKRMCLDAEINIDRENVYLWGQRLGNYIYNPRLSEMASKH